MNKYLSILVALMVTMFAANSFAFTPPSAPTKGWYVSDGTGRLTTVQIGALNDKINRISKTTNNELAIAFVQSLDGTPIEDASYTTFRSWGIGKHGLDNGVLIMLALKEHKSRIETGKGVGGEITDIQAKQILDGLRPQLRNGDFFGAFNNALDGVSGLLDSRANAKFTPAPPPAPVQQPITAPPVDAQPTTQQASGGIGGFGIFLLVLLGLGVAGAALYFFVIVPGQEREEEERRQRELDARRARAESQRLTDERQRLVAERARRAAAPVSVPTIRHTTHHIPAEVSVRPSIPLTPTYVAAPVYVAPVNPQPAQDNTVAIAAAATAAALLEEQREERRAEQRREERREEERREARQREADRDEENRREARREEERRAEARREEEDRQRRNDEAAAASSNSSSSSDSSWSSSDFGSSSSDNSGGGFGGGDSGGGGASSDW